MRTSAGRAETLYKIMSMTEQRHRPIAIILLVMWQFIEGVYGAVLAWLMMKKLDGVPVGLFAVLLAVISFLTVWGLWRLKNWARYLAILNALLALPRGIIGLLRGDIWMVMRLIIYPGIIWYLMKLKTRQLFIVNKALLDALNNSDENIQLKAAIKLGMVKDERAVPFLLTTLKHSTSAIRFRALKALAEIGESVVPTLTTTLGQEDTRFRRAAVETLGYMKNSKAVDPLITALEDEDQKVRQAASEALERLTGRKFGQDAGKWKNWWKKDNDISV